MRDSNVNLALIGCGAHAKRIYVKYLSDTSTPPMIIIDILSSKEDVQRIIIKNNWTNTKTYFINQSDSYTPFTAKEHKEILALFESLNISKAIISTPPEVHTPYAIVCLEAGLKILVDKPLSAPKNISSGNSEELLDDIKNLLKYDKGDNIIVQCQRRRHDGYKYVKQLIQDIDKKYGIQPHFVDIYHSDGRWDFPDEIVTLKNHPYSTGYGKLLHSGYHFVDLLAFLTNEIIYDSFDLFSYKNSINDFKIQIPDAFYKATFNIDNQHIFPDSGYGEIDSYSMIQLKDKQGVKTTASINLLHSGFTRRGWGVAKEDLYKGNGRLRHERVNIQIGPLMNIQIHSYQSTEVHEEQTIHHDDFGGLEHFDIHVFRNTDIIGGKAYEHIKLKTIEKTNGLNTGQNENARYLLIDDFINDRQSHSGIKSHIRTNILLASIAKSMHEKRQISGTFNL